MKQIIGIFIVVLISVAIADLLQGMILTFIYTPDFYAASEVEMVNILRYIIYAITITIALWSTYKVKNLLMSIKQQ